MQAVTPAGAWAACKGTVFLVIGSAFGVGEAMKSSGLAGAVADGVLHLSSAVVGDSSIVGSMVAVGAVTALLSNLMSNTATCVLMVPIATQIINNGGFHAYVKCIVFTL